MADLKISQMTDGGRVAAGDDFPAVRAGANVRVSAGGGAVGLQIYNTATTGAAQDLLGFSTFGKLFIAVATTAAAQSMLEGGAVGIQLFKAATTVAATNALGATTVGTALFQATTTAAAQGTLGFGTFGSLFVATGTTAAAQGMLNISSFGATLTVTADATAARNILLAPGSVITGVSGAAAIVNMVSLTSGNYSSITPVSTTLYFITDAS